jgi:alpha-1,2-mannosyltransferase
MIEMLRTGDWLTRERVRIIAIILLAFYTIATVFLFATSNGRVDRFDRPLGTDYSQVWTAGRFVLEGHPEKPFDNVAHDKRQREYFSETSGFFHWGYPPYFLVVAAFFALFPYALSLILWQAATLPIYLAAVRSIAPFRDGLLAAAAFPAVFVNIGHGHNGFLTAGLMAFGLLALERRPLLAGVLFGLLAYKPQFGILIPIALVAGGYWRTALAAAVTIAAMTLGTWLAFGGETWRGFFAMMTFSREVISEQGVTGWHKIQTVFAAVRMLGGSIPLAYGFQFISTAICAVLVAVLWYGRTDRRLAAAALMTGALLSTPYALDYDMMLLGPALAFVVAYGVEKGFRPWEKSLLALVWFVPIIARNIAEVTFIPVGVLTMFAFMSLIVRHAVSDEQFDWRGRLAARSPLMQQIGVFSAVGAAGFFVDTGLTLFFADAFGISGYVARVPAIVVAVVATWFLNRTWTFRSKDPRVIGEFARYGLASAVTSVFNYAIFCGVLAAFAYQGIAQDTDRLSIGVGMVTGSGAAAVLNFVLSKFFAFARPVPPELARHRS